MWLDVIHTKPISQTFICYKQILFNYQMITNQKEIYTDYSNYLFHIV